MTKLEREALLERIDNLIKTALEGGKLMGKYGAIAAYETLTDADRQKAELEDLLKE